jgi:Tetratricopeptide repeat
MGAGGVITGPSQAHEREILERLGLDERATSEDVARTRDELQAFLASAPKSIRGWARRQASAADEAFLLLSDPTAWRGAGALSASRSRSAFQPGGPATPPVRRATRTPAAPAETAASEGDEDEAFEAMLAEVTPSMHRDRLAKGGAGRARGAGAAAALLIPGVPSARGRFWRPLAVLFGVAAVVIAIVAIYQFGAAPAVTGSQSTPAPTAGLDEARVAELMGRIQQDPNDTDALLELGDAFFQAGDYAAAESWLDKLVALEPTDVRARLALGATKFNLGDSDAAEAQWLEVLRLDTENVEAHYDLGFLYLNETPPDYDSVQREWSEVVRLAPGTDVADVVQQHLDALAAQSAAPSTGASPGPSSVASPGSSPAASPGASTAPTEDPSAASPAIPSGSVAP